MSSRPGAAGRQTQTGRCHAGFTLAELLVVVAIVAILALCVMRAAGSATERADVVRCVGNLRGLHIALTSYLVENTHWPQCPYEVGDGAFDDWWLKEFSKRGISEANWTCPTLMRQNQIKDPTIRQSKIHYIPTNFDENPYTPRKWSRQPWLVEIADSHGEGNLMVFPDGAIIGSTRYLSQHQ